MRPIHCLKLHPGEFTLPQTSRPRGALLPHLFTLAQSGLQANRVGGIFSVALFVG